MSTYDGRIAEPPYEVGGDMTNGADIYDHLEANMHTAKVQVSRPAPGYYLFTTNPDAKFPSLFSMHEDEFGDLFGSDLVREMDEALGPGHGNIELSLWFEVG